MTEEITVSARVTTILEQMHRLETELLHIQKYVCQHPHARRQYHGDTGNYDRSADRFWSSYKCPDCGANWDD